MGRGTPQRRSSTRYVERSGALGASLPNVSAVGGTWLTPAASQAAGDFATIERLAREAITATEGVLA